MTRRRDLLPWIYREEVGSADFAVESSIIHSSRFLDIGVTRSRFPIIGDERAKKAADSQHYHADA